MQETCDGFTNEEIKNDCIAYNNSIIGYYFTESININQKLKTIPKKIDCLYIFTDGVSETIDFNNLRSPTLVSINPFDFSILNSMNSLTKMIKERKTSFLKISKHLTPKEIIKVYCFTALMPMQLVNCSCLFYKKDIYLV